jgi:deoxyadenosine/deoxycytidine kinase
MEGPIGVGKTSLAELLAEPFNARLLLEEAYRNPFLERFYDNRTRYAFQTQIFFLLSRFQQQKELLQPDLFQSGVVSDYLFSKDRIFACLNLDENELALYDRLYKLLDPQTVRPDLVIYLQASSEVLWDRIRRRGMEFENGISLEYLERLIELYHQFFFRYEETPLLVVNTSEIDFVNDPEDLTQLVKKITGVKHGTQHYIPLGSAQR